MKVLVALSAVLASCLATSGIGLGYSAFAPIQSYSGIYSPYSYGYGAPIAGPFVAPLAPAPLATAPIAHAPAALKTQHHSQNELGQASYGHSEPLQSHNAVQDAHGNKVGSYSYVDPHGAVHQTNYVADAAGYRVTSNDLPIAAATPLHRRKRQAWQGAQASPVVTPTGHLAETPEVAAAKAAHFAEHARQNTGAQQSQAQPSWSQPPAAQTATPYSSWGQQQTVPIQSWSQQQAAPAQSWGQQQTAPAQSWSSDSAARSAYPSWNQPQAAPATYPSWSQTQPSWSQGQASGQIADTPEVNAARAAHFAEFDRAAKAAQAAGGDDSGAYIPERNAPVTPASYSQAPSWNQPQGQARADSWNQPQTPSWNQPQAPSWNQPQAPSWNQPQADARATPVQSWNQPQQWSQPQQSSWSQSPSGGIADTPEVAAARAAHFAEHAAASRRVRRNVLYQTPASTAPLTASIVPTAHAASALSYAAPAFPYTAPPAVPVGLIPAVKTIITHNPGHAVSYRVD